MTCWMAIDWGTSTLRCWLIRKSNLQKKPSSINKGSHPLIVGYRSRPWGVKFVKNFGKTLTDIAGDWWKRCEKDVFACGMIGSSIGWKETSYIDIATDARRIRAKKNKQQLVSLNYQGKTIHLQPGWTCGRDDVMRGEETTILGLTSPQKQNKFSKLSGLLVMPGTHSKWVALKCGKVNRFATAITGELFELISKHSIVSQSMHEKNHFKWKSFFQGLEEAKESRLFANLFKLRANYLHGIKNHYRDRLSGQLLGEEIITMGKLFKLNPNTPLYVIGDRPGGSSLTSLYTKGFRYWGFSPNWLNGERLTIEGLLRIRREYFQGKNVENE